jgi:hypothetical protein
MDEESKLFPSNNGSGVTLRITAGEISFTAVEFRLYHSLFKICDNSTQGYISTDNYTFRDLMSRTELPKCEHDQVIEFVINKTTNNATPNQLKKKALRVSKSSTIKLHQWLIICKIFAYLQAKDSHNEVNESLLNDIMMIIMNNTYRSNSNEEYKQIVMVDFSLGSVDYLMKYISKSNHYDIDITDWVLVPGDGYQQQHAIFKIVTKSKSSIEKVNNCRGLQYISEVHRRYSDFEALLHILQKSYRGLIIPALPPKSWNFKMSEAFINHRAKELKIFLNALLEHPLLQSSFELWTFLEASPKGLNSFKENFPLLSNGIGYQGNIVTTFNALTVAGDSVASFASSLWSAMSWNRKLSNRYENKGQLDDFKSNAPPSETIFLTNGNGQTLSNEAERKVATYDDDDDDGELVDMIDQDCDAVKPLKANKLSSHASIAINQGLLLMNTIKSNAVLSNILPIGTSNTSNVCSSSEIHSDLQLDFALEKISSYFDSITKTGLCLERYLTLQGDRLVELAQICYYLRLVRCRYVIDILTFHLILIR